MRVILGFVLLLAGVGALFATIAEPRRYHTEMAPLTGEDRLATFAAAGQTEGKPVAVVPAAVAAVPSTDWVTRTTVASTDDVPVNADNSTALDSATRLALARDIQGELARLGCYAGPLDGVWSPETQRAAGLFTTEANARIPVSEPDFALFSLTKTATEKEACGPAIVAEQKPVALPAAMGLGGLNGRPAKATGYRNDRDVQALFTNPLGR